MSVCCLFGVCIPYSAILPFLLIALQYIAKPLYNAGLLPNVIAQYLGLTRAAATSVADDDDDKKTGCSDSSCCNTARSTVSDDTDETSDGEVMTIDSTEQYEATLSKYKTVVVKFTAEWCKPCKMIHPFYKQLSERYSKNTNSKFIIVDVDELDDVAAEHSVSILPCFAVFKNGKICGKTTGSNEKKLEDFLKEWM
jgi:thioredoxin 1